MEQSLNQSSQTKSRVKKNWGKIRQLFIKNNSKHQDLKVESKDWVHNLLCNNAKNNFYNLFDKSVQVLSKQKQHLIETQYSLKVQIPAIMGQNQLQESHNISLTTLTPLPYKEKILQATSSANTNLSTQIDTTGFWIWEAEEVMAYFIIKAYQSYLNNRHPIIRKENIPLDAPLSKTDEIKNSFQETSKTASTILSKQRQILIDFCHLKTVLQLGAGSSGLASMALAQIIHLQTLNSPINSNILNSPSITVNITDGKLQNIQYLNKNIQTNFETQNKNNFGRQTCLKRSQISVKAELMLWGTQINNKYDIILAADCLFFQQYHHQLIKTLQLSMHQSSVALFINPRRGKSMERFVLLAQKYFQILLIDFDDETYKSQEKRIKLRQDFNPDKHLFNFVFLRKKKSQIYQDDEINEQKRSI